MQRRTFLERELRFLDHSLFGCQRIDFLSIFPPFPAQSFFAHADLFSRVCSRAALARVHLLGVSPCRAHASRSWCFALPGSRFAFLVFRPAGLTLRVLGRERGLKPRD